MDAAVERIPSGRIPRDVSSVRNSVAALFRCKVATIPKSAHKAATKIEEIYIRQERRRGSTCNGSLFRDKKTWRDTRVTRNSDFREKLNISAQLTCARATSGNTCRVSYRARSFARTMHDSHPLCVHLQSRDSIFYAVNSLPFVDPCFQNYAACARNDRFDLARERDELLADLSQ